MIVHNKTSKYYIIWYSVIGDLYSVVEGETHDTTD